MIASKKLAAVFSLADYHSMEETAYLLSSPANQAHLERSLKQAQSGKLVNFPVEDL